MARCLQCQKDWPPHFSRCPSDGTRLNATLAETPAEPRVQENANQLPPGTMAGEYRIVERLGEGAMGTVYGALHPVIGRRAAVKVIHLALCADADAVERFVQEARAVNQIHHPTICEVFSFGVLPDGRRFSVMEWLEGETLSAHMEQRGRLPLAEAIAILEPICEGLSAAHARGIIHRDLKPENIFLVAGPPHAVKLLDFGLAKLAIPGMSDRLERTRTGQMMGTPLYVSPEQSRGREIDHRTDLYSLGAIVFHMVAGAPPFDADNVMDLIAHHLQTPAPPLRKHWPDAPPALETLLLRLMDKQPEGRPSLEEVKATLAELKSLPLPRRRNRKFGFAVAAGLLTCLGFATALRRPTSTSTPAPARVAAQPLDAAALLPPHDAAVLPQLPPPARHKSAKAVDPAPVRSPAPIDDDAPLEVFEK